jgi:hypothetical protein
VVVSTAVRFAVAKAFDVPWIAPDEVIYGLVGESLWESGTLSIRGANLPYYSLLTPALVGLPYALAEDAGTGLAGAQLLQALAMSLAAVPVYLWGRRLASPGWALVAAGLTVLPPALWYGGLLMTEALFYTTVTVALLALARMLEEPTLERQGLFLLALSVAAAVRLQALLLLPALLLAAALHAWFGRSTATIRRLVPVFALLGGSAVVLLLVYADDRGDLLGAYGAVTETTATSSANLVEQLVWHTGALVVMTLGLPLLATATLAVRAAVGGEEDSPLRAFLAATSAYVVLLVGQVSAFAVSHLDRVSERYLITALPPLILGLCVWIARGAPRPLRIVVPLSALALLAVAALPGSRFATRLGAHDALTAIALVDLAEWSEATFRIVLLASATVAVAAFALLPRRRLPLAVVGIAIGLVVLSGLSARKIDSFSAVEHGHDFGASADWIDSVGADGDVLLIDTGEQPSTAPARTTFWNHSVRELARLSGVPEQALPQVPFDIRRDGALTDAQGRELSAPYAAAPLSMQFAGTRLVSTPATDIAPGSGLWEVQEPLRLRARTGGFSPIGDFRHATVVVYRCGAGTLELDLLGKDGEPIAVRFNGFPHETIEVPPQGQWSGAVRPLIADPSQPCQFELESDGLVGSTRVEWVPEGG